MGTKNRTLPSAVLALLLSSLCIGQETAVQQTDGGALQKEDTPSLARRLATGPITRNFVPSLEMREAADFLLTPAVLAQEAVLDGVVTTYPAE